ncbi:MAG: sigma-70 family RNA polymerase sigma factor [bacterium]|nr:sigma-70 family RNA polymerase sigma factor [bacterium]
MTPPPPRRNDPQELLAQTGWMRALAARLVADPARAEDLVQDALVVALERRPEEGPGLRAWLGEVVRRIAHGGRRGEARRATRERRAARDEAQPSFSETNDRLVAHRALVEELDELPEPYRTTLLLRFFDDLPPRVIAARQGVPVKTVQTRLARGVDKLRARLVARGGGRGTWLSALAPLALPGREPTALFSTLTGAIAMNTGLKVAAIVGLAIAAGSALRSTATETPDLEPGSTELATVAPRPRPAQGPDSDSAPGVRVVEAPQDEQPTRTELSRPRPSGVQHAAGEEESFAATVRVVDVAASAVAGVALVQGRGREAEPALGADGEPSVSGPDGRASIAFTRAGVSIATRHDDWVDVYDARLEAHAQGESVIVVAQPITYSGHVVTPEGRGVSSARVHLLASAFETRFPLALERSSSRAFSTRCDGDGYFELRGVPLIPNATLRATAPGFLVASLEAPGGDAAGLVLSLALPGVGDELLSGVVLDASGQPVEGARVAMGAFGTSTDAAGEFRVDLGLAVDTQVLRAVKAGHLPAERTAPEPSAPGARAWPERVELVLGGEPRRLKGVVLGENGEPRSGAHVWLVDPTLFGVSGMSPIQLEGLLGGVDPDPSGAEPGDSQLAGALARGAQLDDKGIRRRADATWPFVTTDGHGEFELFTRPDRTYRLAALDPDTLAMVESAPIDPGTARVMLELRGTKSGAFAGVVRDERGAPLPGLRVRAMIEPFETHATIGAGKLSAVAQRAGASTVTDAEGRFRLPRVPYGRLAIEVLGDAILPLERRLREDEDPAQLELALETRCPLEVVVESETIQADSVRLLDDAQELVFIWALRGGGLEVNDQWPLVEGRTGRVTAGVNATKIELLLGGQQVHAQPIALVPGQLTTLTF